MHLTRGGVKIGVFGGTFRALYFDYWFADFDESSQNTNAHFSLHFDTKSCFGTAQWETEQQKFYKIPDSNFSSFRSKVDYSHHTV